MLWKVDKILSKPNQDHIHRELEEAGVAKQVAESVERLRETELGLAELRERKAGLERRRDVRRARLEEMAGRAAFRGEMCAALRKALGPREETSHQSSPYIHEAEFHKKQLAKCCNSISS